MSILTNFNKTNNPYFNPSYILSLSQKTWGFVAFAEIVVALFYSKRVFERNGKPAHLNQIADAFAMTFNIDFGSIYDQQEPFYDRKPFNRTQTLDFLRNLIVRMDKGQNIPDEKYPFCSILINRDLCTTNTRKNRAIHLYINTIYSIFRHETNKNFR